MSMFYWYFIQLFQFLENVDSTTVMVTQPESCMLKVQLGRSIEEPA